MVVFPTIGLLAGWNSESVQFFALPAVFPDDLFPERLCAAGGEGGAGVHEDFQRCPHRLALLYGKLLQHRQATEDAVLEALCASSFRRGR